MTTISSGQTHTVSSGQTDTGDIVLGGGTLDVLSGGTISNTVDSGGADNVAGSAVDTTVSSGGYETVLSGGSASGTIVGADGIEQVNSGGTANGTIVGGGGLIAHHGQEFVYGTANGTIVGGGGGDELVFSGGTASGTIVTSGGVQNIDGGTASGTTVSNAAVEALSGGTTNGTTLIGGEEDVLGGTASGTIVFGGGVQRIYGGTASGTIVSSGGFEFAFGGTASGTIVSAGGVEEIFSGGMANGTIVSSGGVEEVFSGGMANGTIVSSGGVEQVGLAPTGRFSGGTTNGTIVSSGGVEVVGSGGTASATTIGGGTLELQASAVVSGGIVFAGSGGTLQIDGTTMPTATISGFASGDTIDLNGVNFDSAGSATVGSGNVLKIVENGNTYNLSLSTSQSFAGASFKLSPDSVGGTDLVLLRDDDTGEQAALALAVNGGHPIGAATAGAVPFTVGGLESDDSGAVTFSDGNNAHNVVVSIASGVPAASTANLTGLNDGPITATLHLNNDAAGNSFTNVSVNATLDQDTGEQAALSLAVNGGHPIGAATASAVPFTVGGLQSDDSGTVSFGDGSHAAVVVNITNGVPAATTANLAGLTDGTITATLHLNNDAAGNSFTNVTAAATLDTDRLAEKPTLMAPSSLTVAAGGSVAMGISVTPADSDDAVFVGITGVPRFETITAGDGHLVPKLFGGTYIFTAADVNTAGGLTLHSSYGGTGHPVDKLIVAAANTTAGELAATIPPKTITVTDPPAIPQPNQDLALLNQFSAAGFHEQDGLPILPSGRTEINSGAEAFLTQPHH
jgi:autotransporter passenger strand-loop-strand repeat protein